MIKWILIGVVAYLAIGLFTAIKFLVNRGRSMLGFWEKSITEKNFDEEDELFAFCVIFLWPPVWIFIGAVKLMTAIERYIVVPIVNKKEKKEIKEFVDTASTEDLVKTTTEYTK